MPSISVILPTARDDYPVIGLPEMYLLYPTFEALLQQTFTDFEVVVVDALYPQRKKWLERDWPFLLKYVPVHPNHRFWLDRKRWNVCGALNTGILHAEGELLVRVDDCSEFETEFLQKFWDGYQKGYFPLAMHTRFKGGKQAYYNERYRREGYDIVHAPRTSWEITPEQRRKALDEIYSQGDPVRDTRWRIVEQQGGRMIAPPDWYYGYSSISLQAALDVNGYNELFDGDKSLEDSDMGSRLTLAGYKNMFLLDINHYVIEHEHLPISEDLIPTVRPIKCNYAILLLNRRKNLWRANTTKLTEEDAKFIIQESLKPPCSPKPHFYDQDCRGKLFKLWFDNQPLFDLREERLAIA